MYTTNKHGFTLIELLVVITIIGTLMALLLPAVNAARNSARKSTCLNNLHNVSVAALNYHTNERSFPYARTTYGKNTGSWVVSLLSYLEERELSKDWLENDKASADTIPILICPADAVASRPADGDSPLSYPANCGLDGMTSDTSKANISDCGVFVDGTVATKGRYPRRCSLDAIRDGASYTILLAENVQSTRWNVTDIYGMGIIWLNTSTPPVCSNFNRCYAKNPSGTDVRNATGKDYARPSSFHNGGAHVAFADNGVRFLSTAIDYLTYCQLMAPNDDRAAEQSGVSAMKGKLNSILLGQQ